MRTGVLVLALIANTGCVPFGPPPGNGNTPQPPTTPGTSTGTSTSPTAPTTTPAVPTAPTTTVVQPSLSVMITQATSTTVSGYVSGGTPTLTLPPEAPSSTSETGAGGTETGRPHHRRHHDRASDGAQGFGPSASGGSCSPGQTPPTTGVAGVPGLPGLPGAPGSTGSSGTTTTSAPVLPIFVDLMAVGPSVQSTGATTGTTSVALPNPLPILSTVASTDTTAVGAPPGVPAFTFDLTRVTPDRAADVAPGRTVSVNAHRADGAQGSSPPVVVGGP